MKTWSSLEDREKMKKDAKSVFEPATDDRNVPNNQLIPPVRAHELRMKRRPESLDGLRK